MKDYALFLKGFDRFPSGPDIKLGQTGLFPLAFLLSLSSPFYFLSKKREERKKRKSVGGWYCRGRNTDVSGL